MQKLGFYPDKKVGGYEIEYNLYDFPDQCLIYHLFLNHIQQKYVESSTLVLIFDKHSINVSALNEGAIYNKFNSLENGWKKKYYSRIKMDDFKSIVDFIAAISDSFDGLDLILCYMDNDEKKDELLDLFKQIKKYAEEKIDEYPIDLKNKLTYLFNLKIILKKKIAKIKKMNHIQKAEIMKKMKKKSLHKDIIIDTKRKKNQKILMKMTKM